MNYTILIVDDDMAINDMLVKYLRKNGYITYSAYSGTEALLFLEKQKVNLIILDLMLPGLSGEQVLAEIKKTKNVPVIGLSAKEDSKSKIFLLKNGADDYVTKGVKESLDEDLIFALNTIFCSKFGFNMRNNVAHGMLDDQAFQSFKALYIWWFALKFCYLFCGKLQEENRSKINKKLKQLMEKKDNMDEN